MLRISYSIADQRLQTTASVGIYNISLGLLSGLAKSSGIIGMSVFSNSTISGSLQLPEHVNLINCDGAIRSKWRRIVWDQWGVYQMAQKTHNEWLFLPKGFAPFIIPCPVKLAVYIHDIIPVFYADSYPGSVSRIRQLYFQRCYAATLRQAKIVFTNTQFTRSEIERWANNREIKCPPIVVAGYGFTQNKAEMEKKDRFWFLSERIHINVPTWLSNMSSGGRERRFSQAK